jgi:hypothetical protein
MQFDQRWGECKSRSGVSERQELGEVNAGIMRYQVVEGWGDGVYSRDFTIAICWATSVS